MTDFRTLTVMLIASKAQQTPKGADYYVPNSKRLLIAQLYQLGR